MAKDDVESVTEDESNTSGSSAADAEDRERSRYWDEAVGVKEGGKEPPVEEEPTPEPEPDSKEEEVEEVSEPESEDSEDAEDTEEEEVEETDQDPWESAPEALRKEFEDTKAKYEHDIRSQRGRVGALQKQINDLSRKLEEATAKESPAGSDQPNDQGDSLFSTEKWKKFKENYGEELSDPIESLIRDSYKELRSGLQDAHKVSQELRSAEDERKWSAEAESLEKAWPNWRDFVESNREAFDDFVQSDETANALFKVNEVTLKKASAAKSLLVLFKEHLNETKPATSNGEAKSKPEPRPLTPKQKAQLKSAATIAPRSHPAPGRRSDDLPDPDAYEDAERYFLQKATTR